MTEPTVNEEKNKRNRYPDRFTITPNNLEKIGSLLEQLRFTLKGCDATRKDMLNWIIEKFPEQLNEDSLKELAGRFYDEERFLKFALGEVRAAKARGEQKTLEQILQNKPNGINHYPIHRERKRKSKIVNKEEQTLPDNQAS